MRKLTLLLAAGIGYVLGTRAGRERYEQIKSLAFKVKEDPRVQSAASTAREHAPAVAQTVGQKVTAAAGVAASAAASHSPFGGNDHGERQDELREQLDPDSTARQDNPYPQGDLP